MKWVLIVKNNGTTPLNVGDVQLPTGSELSDGLNHVIPAEETDRFTIRMLNTGVGQTGGVVRFSTNESNETAFY